MAATHSQTIRSDAFRAINLAWRASSDCANQTALTMSRTCRRFVPRRRLGFQLAFAAVGRLVLNRDVANYECCFSCTFWATIARCARKRALHVSQRAPCALTRYERQQYPRLMQHTRRSLHPRSALLLSMLALGFGCDSEGATDDGPSDSSPGGSSADPSSSLCPQCSATPGVVTTPSSPSLCTHFEVTSTVDHHTAVGLGYNLAALDRAVETGIDLPLRWEPKGSSTVTGYTPTTRIRGVIEALSYERVSLHPVLCDGTTCVDGPRRVPQSGCPDRLVSRIRVSVETSDDALTVDGLEGRLLQSSNDPTPEGAVEGALRSATGTLRVVPPPPEGEPGLVELALALSATGEISGSIYPRFVLNPTPLADFAPIIGTFP